MNDDPIVPDGQTASLHPCWLGDPPYRRMGIIVMLALHLDQLRTSCPTD